MLESLTLDQLKIFVTVAQCGGFAAAGRELGRAQSVISYAISNLEQGLGVELFDRAVKRQIGLTLVGQSLLEDAKRVLAETTRLYDRAAAMSQGLEPQVTLVIDAMFPTPALVALCAEFGQRFEQVKLQLYTEALGAVSARVLESEHAVGVQGPDGLDERRVAAIPLARVELIPVVSATHPLAQLEAPQPLAQLERYTQLILTDRSDYTQDHSQGVLNSPSRQWNIADLGAKRELLLAGLGWGNMPTHMVAQALQDGLLARLYPEPWQQLRWELPLYAITAKAQPIGQAQRWVMERLQTLCAEHVEPLPQEPHDEPS